MCRPLTQDRPKPAPAKPIVVGGTMGFMSWLAEAKSKAKPGETGETVETVEEDPSETINEATEELVDESPEPTQVHQRLSNTPQHYRNPEHDYVQAALTLAPL